MGDDRPRLIEVAFPLKQASLDSVHEKNVRHGHISTLHIWPARRPLAACRAALIAMLLPDPGNEAERRRLLEKLAGTVKKENTYKNVGGRRVPVIKEMTEGGILHWGRENGPALDFFREEIKKAYGGRAPRVLDPFAGGGAIPLEAMRLGCEVTAIDINPVAWFILKCTLEYPQRLAGQTRALTLNPSPIGRGTRVRALPLWHDGRPGVPETLLARARELRQSQTTAEALLWECLRDRRLNDAKFRRQHVVGPYIADFYCHEARLVVEAEGGVHQHQVEEDAVRQQHLEELGYTVLRFSNKEVFSQTESVLGKIAGHLPSPCIPLPGGEGRPSGQGEGGEGTLADHVRAWGHWVLERARRDLERFYPTIDGKPTVAYLWARTVTCKNCRATIPLLKTLWLCKKDKKRIRLALKPRSDKTGVDFGIVSEPVVGGNAAQRHAHDQQAGQGTMSRAGAWCPVCGNPGTVAMTMEDIRAEGMAGRLGAQMTAVVVGPHPGSLSRWEREGRQARVRAEGKEYRLPTPKELIAAHEAAAHVDEVFKDVPFGLPTEPTPKGGGSGAGRAFSVQNYGMTTWASLFTPRQLVALGTFVKHTRAARDAMRAGGYPPEWVEAVSGYLTCMVSRTVDYMGTLCVWETHAEEVKHTFMRWALPITWDFAEANPICPAERFYLGGLNSALRVLRNLQELLQRDTTPPAIFKESAIAYRNQSMDLVFTDPPYYDAIPYSDLMDFFYVWLRRACHGLTPNLDKNLAEPLGPKWNADKGDGELIDDDSRHGGNKAKSVRAYEEGMYRAFVACGGMVREGGHLVVVFANKNPAAWETLAASMIRAGFCVTASWPIVTEMPGGLRNLGRASLASSIWLVSRKRPETARPGWDNQVLEEMRSNIYEKLRAFWDAGIRGPDFVWAATGPALEAYSKHPIVKKADQPDAVMSVSEFLAEVRRIVVDYVVGRVLSRNGNGEVAEGLDNITIYYLLHRHDFGLGEAPVGASILYAQSCKLSDRDLATRYDLLAYGKGKAALDVEDEAENGEEEPSPSIPLPEGEGRPSGQGEGAPSTGSTVKLKPWHQRRNKNLGLNQGGRVAPLIDQVHRMMHLWRAGDVQKVDSYLEEQGLRLNPVFPKVLQALIELARKDNQSDEVSLLESITNHVTARGAHPQMRLASGEGEA